MISSIATCSVSYNLVPRCLTDIHGIPEAGWKGKLADVMTLRGEAVLRQLMKRSPCSSSHALSCVVWGGSRGLNWTETYHLEAQGHVEWSGRIFLGGPFNQVAWICNLLHCFFYIISWSLEWLHHIKKIIRNIQWHERVPFIVHIAWNL